MPPPPCRAMERCMSSSPRSRSASHARSNPNTRSLSQLLQTAECSWGHSSEARIQQEPFSANFETANLPELQMMLQLRQAQCTREQRRRKTQGNIQKILCTWEIGTGKRQTLLTSSVLCSDEVSATARYLTNKEDW